MVLFFNVKSGIKISKYALVIAFLMTLSFNSFAQYQNKWLSVGSLQNWYSEIGSEIEEGGFVKTQQDGLMWPAIYRYQDMQAMKGMWIGAKNWKSENGESFPYKVVAVGPRPPSFYSYFPVKFDLIGKFDVPIVTVDGKLSAKPLITLDAVDPTMVFDRLLDNVVNTSMGITVHRKMMQFAQQFNDNYIVNEYTFTNTGNTNADPAIELKNQTLSEVYFYFAFRYAVNNQGRYAIGNGSGWGINTMNDTRGDGTRVDPVGEKFRAQFSWHGYWPGKDVTYDNIGGPVFAITATAKPYFDAGDTIGRLASYQFIGNMTLHADKSATDHSDDLAQPATTAWEGSDRNEYKAGNDATNLTKMTLEYALMSKGHMSPRHAEAIGPYDNLAAQVNAPDQGNGGGFSNAVGYGPYNMAFGDSVKIVWIEAAAGMGYDKGVEIGRQFKRGAITPLQKNVEVMKGKDSLMAVYQKATDAYKANWVIPQPPMPPKTFEVASGGDRVMLSWTPQASDPNPPTAYLIYRALGNVDSAYRLVKEVGPTVTSYEDTDLSRGFDYYYYIVAVGAPTATAGPGTPAGSKLISGRYYTQTYDPARLKRQAGTALSQIRVVPNPFNISASVDKVRFPGGQAGDRIAFYDIPGKCTIKIYTEMGELIKTIEHIDGSGDEFWTQVTSSSQVVVSGIYIAVITDNTTGQKQIAKFAIIR